MASDESFYEGAPSSNAYSEPSPYQTAVGNLGVSMDPRTANQLGELNLRLNPGVKTIEVQGTFANVLESIPEQHLDEMRRISKLTGSDLTLHGPLLNASGVEMGQGQQGYQEENRVGVEKQMESALLRARKLSEDGGTPVTFHSTANLPNFEPHVMVQDEDGKSTKVKKGLMIIDETTGQVGQINDEGRYLGEDGQFTGEKLGFNSKRELDRRNKELWLNSLTRINQSVQFGESALDNLGRRTVDQEVIGPEGISKIQKIDITDIKDESDKKRVQSLQGEIDYGHTYLKESYRGIKDLFDKAMTTSKRDDNKKDIDKLREFAEFTKGKISKDFENDINQLGKLREVVDTGLRTLSTIDSTPQTFRPLKEFAIEKSAETFANVAQTAYNKHGSAAPVISIENPPGGEGLSTGEDLRDLIKSSRTQLAKNLKREGMSGSEAKRVAANMIGATWDVGHINMMRKKGYTEKDLIKQTKEIAPFVKHVHLSDNFGLDHTELPMGMGNVPLKPMINEIKKAGFKGKEIVEAGNWWQHFADKGGGNPFKPSIEGLDSPIYAMAAQGGPGWANAGAYSGYFSGQGPISPQVHHSLYGAGFQNLPIELGGEVAGDRGRFSGNPNQ